ncbi:hypothetical protein A2U01_0111828, partial [Trifolium medium]|nr:hypothetical protein [Trifolium medium]
NVFVLCERSVSTRKEVVVAVTLVGKGKFVIWCVAAAEFILPCAREARVYVGTAT